MEIRLLIDAVEDGMTSEYTCEIEGEEVWKLFKGNKGIYHWNKEVPCFSFWLRTEMGWTIVTNQMNKQEIADTLANQEERWETIKENAESIGKYLTSPEGKWGV